MTRAFVFPGQGSQFVGMAKSLADAFPAARHLLQEIDEALSQNLSRLMFEGPEGDLILTENAQPALMAASLAALRALESEAGFSLARHGAFVAGHSLGEYSALAAAGSITVADTARLLKLRGLAMQRAVPVGVGAMAALLGADWDLAQQVAAEAANSGEKPEICAAANDNAPGQVVISGHKGAVERAIELAKARGVKRAMLLPVSAPFHCPLMQPAADEMREALAKVAIAAPAVPLVANVTAAATSDPETIRRQLVEQVTGAVRWRESVLALAGYGVTQLVEIGAGKVLSGLAKRIHPDMTAANVQDPADVDAFLKSL